MNQNARATISVQGSSMVRQQPSFLILLGKIHASAPTLELALQNLKQKREAVSRWLNEMAAENLEIGQPRFPDQVEPDPLRMAHAMARRRLGRQLAKTPQEDSGKRSLFVGYSAQWPIAGRSSEEVLIFVDRIQFEVADLQETQEETPEQTPAWESNPMQEMQSMMSDMGPPPEGDEIHCLFLSSMTAEQHGQALAEAFRDGRGKAAMMARAAGKELDDLVGAHWSSPESDAIRGVQEIQRRSYLPLLAETPFRTSANQAIHKSLKPAEFIVSVQLTFGLK